MPIEFRCTQCQRLLRTGDDAAGKQARCPECGAIVPVPYPGPSAPQAGAPLGPGVPPGAGPGGLFVPGGPLPGYPADSVNPYQSPLAPSTVTGAGYAGRAVAPTLLDLSDVFSRAWTIYKNQMGICIAAILIVGAINFGLGMIDNAISSAVEVGGRDPSAAAAVSIFCSLVTNLIAVWIGIGETLFFLKVARGHPVNFGELFQGGPWFLTTLFAGILAGLAVFLGLMLCIVPGIIFALMFSQFWYVIVDRNAGIIESLGLSKRLTDGNKVTLLGIYLLVFLINLGGLLACCIGLLFTASFTTLLGAVIYLALTGQPTADMQYRAGFVPFAPGAGPPPPGPPGGTTASW